jgi:hypothetical protein
MLMVSYIRRFETGTIARKNGAIARKSVTRPRSRGVAVRNPAIAHRLGLVGGAGGGIARQKPASILGDAGINEGI